MRSFCKIIATFICLCLYQKGLAQQLMWAHGTGSTLADQSNTIHTDNAGNVYTAGKFAGTNVDFDPSPTGTFLLSAIGLSDGYVAKYSATGQFIWAFRFGGNSRDEVYDLHVDQTNNTFYITGFFRGSNVDFDPGTGVANLTSNGDGGTDPGYGGDIFIAKYDLAGQYIWAFNVGGNELYDNGLAVETDAAGNLYVGGYFTHTADFDPSPTSSTILNSATGGSIFLAKYTSAGAFQWAFNLGSPTTNNSMFDLKVDAAGNVYTTGYFQGSNIDFDPSPGTAILNSNGNYEVFVAKYNSSGQYQFAFSVGGTGADVGRGLALDNNGNIYVLGDFHATVDFNPGPGVANLTSNGQGDCFFAKYNSLGQYVWAFNFGGTPDEYGWKVGIDGTHLFITGSFSGTADFDPSPAVENLTSAGGYDIFMGKYSLNGEYLCSFKIGGPGDDSGVSIYSNSTNTFYLTGRFANTNVDFDPSASVFNLSSAGSDDIFVAKYSWPDNLAPAGTISGNTICSGGQGQLTFNATVGTGPFTIVYNNGTSNVTVTNVQSGVPFNIVPNPAVTTTYSLVSIRDASRCSETRLVSGVTTNVTVNTCAADCVFWPVFGLNNYSAPIPFSNNVSFSFSNPALLVPNAAYSTMTPGNWFTPNPTIATTSPPNTTAHNPADIGAIGIFPTTVNDQGTITFSSPTTTGFFLHIYQTVSRLDFDHSFSLVSSDGDLHVGNSGSLTNNVIIPDVGPSQSPDDANATIFFPAGITQLKFTITSAPAVGGDGIRLAFTFPDNCAPVPCSNWLLTPSNGSKVTVGDLDITGNQVTVEALFNRAQPLNSGVYYGHLVSKHTDQTNINYSLFPNGCSITTDVSGYKETFQTCLLDLNRVYHVAMVYDGTSLKYYRDGLLMSQVPCTGNMINNNLATTIGQVAGGADLPINQFLGYVNEVRIWNVARTQSQLQSYMNTSLPNPTTQAGLKGYYSFNDLLNKQGNTAWNGSLSGAASINQTNPNCSFTSEVCNTTVVTAGFTLPDTVCVNTPVTITNTSVNGSTFYWNFCSGSLNATPSGSNFSSPNLSLPVFIDLVQEGSNYYVFVVNHTGSLSRMNFGNSLLNTPTITNLGSFGGIIPFQAEGIEIQKDGSNWIGYIIGGQNANSRLLKLSFGTSVANTPTATNLGNIGTLDYPVDFTLQKDGNNWYGFTVSADNNTVTRYNFGTSLNNVPVATNLGNIGGLDYPVGIFLMKNGANYHLFITNRNSHTISRLDFGTSLANIPAGTNLGNPGNNFNWPRDITVIKDCDKTFGFVTNEGTNSVTRLDFNNNLLAIPVTTNLGNIGNMNFPSSISEIFRTGDAVNFMSANVNSNSITRVTFNNCTTASIPSYIGTTPPPFQYSQPGTYNISLFVDDGLATQNVVCKQIVVKDCGRVLTGIINDYTEVLAFDPCKNSLTVANASAYNIGDTVLIIQMKGAIIDTTNTASFGTITDYKNAGNYEFNYVKSKNGNIIELKNFLTRSYDLPDGKVQLVRVPFFQDAVVSSALTCLPWDGGKGGVVVFNVANALQLNANIDVSGKGFRGGAGYNSGQLVTNCFTNGYYYPLSSGNIAAIKGESISTISNNIIRGKGALAGAGGGGLDHNSGGGGGGNGGSGGFGGYQLEPCGNAPFDNRGIGGKNLVYNNAANKIFMGSGGGAGHANNPADASFPPSGGNGSGIVIISAQSLRSNSFKIIAEGANAPTCNVATTNDCHDAMGGGGGGGTVLLNIPTVNDNSTVEIKGGKGADMSGPVPTAGRIGSGGGGGGGVFWSNAASIPANVIVNGNGGANGVLLTDGNSAWGATPGSNGTNIFNLQLPVDNVPFKPNIDSVRIKDSITGCTSFDFKGFGYINNYPVAGWQWYFGDGNTANTQNTSHTYTTTGTFTVKLVITDINGCKDSISKNIIAAPLDFDFSYQVNACSPLSVQFNGTGSNAQNPYWSFGDAASALGTINPVHIYPAQNTYLVAYSVNNGSCSDTIRKPVALAIIPDDIITTHDTTICFGSTKQLLTIPSANFCWSPITYLDNPNSPNPITSTPQNITYYFTAVINGNNIISNGDFSQGNTGFTSQYIYTTPNANSSPGQYFVGPNPQAWSAGFSPCTDHTTGNGNMMIVNATTATPTMWSQTVAVQPNTNYAFSAWMQRTTNAPTGGQMQLSINGINVGPVFNANLSPCIWQHFSASWNSGANTSAVISLLVVGLPATGTSGFALDDISFFTQQTIKRDSVRITVDTATVRTTDDLTVCAGTPVQLNTTGAATYSWSPATGLSNATIANPVALPVATTQYFVTGTNSNGCSAKDSVTISINPKPTITKSGDVIICKNASTQLSASGGTNYLWSPAATLNNPNISNPVASPTGNTTYYLSVTDANTCSNVDSIKVSIRPDPVFTISSPVSICKDASAQLTAGGGNIYSWQPSSSLNNAAISNPKATPVATTNYSVQITETNCNISTILSTTVTVNPQPNIKATKANDIDCSNDRSQLNATGAQTYIWSPATSLNNPAIPNPVAMPTTTTMYLVKGTDASGCSNYDSVLVDFAPVNPSGYFMPNAFTPNGDGKNDCYGIKFWGIIQELEFSIYNRWGERVFFTKNPNDCWDGKYKGQEQSSAVFVYMIKAKTLCGSTFKKGLLTLIR